MTISFFGISGQHALCHSYSFSSKLPQTKKSHSALLSSKNLSVETGTKKKKEKLDEVDLAQMSLFDTVKDDDILEELKNVDLSNMTPIDALNKLYELQNKIKNRW